MIKEKVRYLVEGKGPRVKASTKGLRTRRHFGNVPPTFGPYPL
jgi:hypothetical protein